VISYRSLPARLRVMNRLVGPPRCSSAAGWPLIPWNTSTVDLPPEEPLQLRSDDLVGDSSTGKPQEQSGGPGWARRWEGATKPRTAAPNRWSSTTAAQELVRSRWCPESPPDEKAAGADAQSQGRRRAEAALWWCWVRTGARWCWTVGALESPRGGLCPLPVRRCTDQRTQEPRPRLPPRRLRP
jgi:hypothetical protein